MPFITRLHSGPFCTLTVRVRGNASIGRETDSLLEEAGFEHLVPPKTPGVPAVMLGSEERQSLDIQYS